MNGHEYEPRQSRRRPPKKLSEKELAFAKSGLEEMNRLVEKAMRMDERLEELEPRFKGAAMQKAWVVIAVYFVGSLGLLFSIFWSGLTVILIRVGIVGFLTGLYMAPVHYFVRGDLRADARLARDLDKTSMAHARKAARIGQTMNKRLRKTLGARR